MIHTAFDTAKYIYWSRTRTVNSVLKSILPFSVSYVMHGGAVHGQLVKIIQ